MKPKCKAENEWAAPGSEYRFCRQGIWKESDEYCYMHDPNAAARRLAAGAKSSARAKMKRERWAKEQTDREAVWEVKEKLKKAFSPTVHSIKVLYDLLDTALEDRTAAARITEALVKYGAWDELRGKWDDGPPPSPRR